MLKIKKLTFSRYTYVVEGWGKTHVIKNGIDTILKILPETSNTLNKKKKNLNIFETAAAFTEPKPEAVIVKLNVPASKLNTPF